MFVIKLCTMFLLELLPTIVHNFLPFFRQIYAIICAEERLIFEIKPIFPHLRSCENVAQTGYGSLLQTSVIEWSKVWRIRRVETNSTSECFQEFSNGFAM